MFLVGRLDLRIQPAGSRLAFGKEDLLRWLFLGRATLATALLLAATLGWLGGDPPVISLLLLGAFAGVMGMTALSAWYSRAMAGRIPVGFLYLQILFDSLLVTLLVHHTGGGDSVFAPLYILVISLGALLLPLPGGVLVGFLCSVFYFADAVVGHGEPFSAPIFLQMGLFGLVAIITGWLGDRVRRAGIALGTVESQLQRLRITTDDILANIQTGILTVDGSGGLVYLNPAGEELLGIKAEDWDAQPVLEAVAEVAPDLGKVLVWTAEERRPLARFKTVARRGGRESTLGISTTVVSHDPEERPSVTAIFQDITDQEQLKALDRRADRIEVIAELAASLAHEIKNPLASIRSSVEQITKPTLGEEDREVLGRLVLTESDRLSRLLTEFLEFSSLKMGQREEVDFARLVRECTAVLEQHPEVGGGVRLECSGLEEEVWIPGDGDLLHRAVFNLLLNAVQFSGFEGVVRVQLQARPEGEGALQGAVDSPVRFSVQDSGPGIDPKQVSRIFDPFFTTREGGSGMGLAVVHRAVEAHHGAVFVERAPEGGAEFIIYLPRSADGGAQVA
jgi:two-component system sensor histidine kinase PilS (NtrC family)